MASTYCGKSCEECSFRETLHCPGCKEGPGKLVSGDCEIAKCCREKGHDSCSTCLFTFCGKLQQKGSAPKERQRREAEEVMRKKELAQKSVFSGAGFGSCFV